ncbi:MAG: hypothetical protein JW984_04700 [Deltaproteobacteria bacterium]|uniref:DUF4845 domain-containing protein n=1 Tax=Candidatus Zymogenus saltonus TaxID=2844893 RepID=A0A9D8PMP4_9DELT|nr:hypothetical protein [Candidatus Zymogenus saltonus]
MKNRIRSLLSGERGATRFKTLVIILIIAAIGYGGLKVAKPYYDWFRVKKIVKELAIDCRNQPKSCIEGALPRKVRAISSDPLEGEIEIKKSMGGKKTTIIMDYDVEVVFIPDKFSHVFSFHIEESNM